MTLDSQRRGLPLVCVLGLLSLVSKGFCNDGHQNIYDDLVVAPHPPAPPPSPQVDPTRSNNVTGLLGRTAILNCRVRNLGNKTVSWVRRRDLHLLTVGRYTYTFDERFRAIHKSGSDDWILRLNHVQSKDAGSYECHISTTPPISHSIHLTVIEPTTQIVGEPYIYTSTRHTLNLTCVIKFSPEPPVYIIWKYNSEVINSDSPRRGVIVTIERGDVTTSSLFIEGPQPTDSGVYECIPSNAPTATAEVYILREEEHPVPSNDSGQTMYNFSSFRNVTLSVVAFLVKLQRFFL